METKFQYQVSPELAEKIAIEQHAGLLRLRWVKLGFLPLGMAVLGGLILLVAAAMIDPDHTLNIRIGGVDYAFNGGFMPLSIGSAFGFGFGLLIERFIHSRIAVIARSAYKKMGPMRMVSWNPEGILLQFATFETKIQWQMIDKIEARRLALYGFFRQKALFAIPREVFPSVAAMEDLIKAWQSNTGQPLILT